LLIKNFSASSYKLLIDTFVDLDQKT